ncbi:MULTISPECIES: hydantoinase B/oxoprolinase family protein [unclassified Minwuia]|jgi:N-methylhydantoinase B|uniref:hydantoinase B/oxoprolinase family protein n=1 Tax=unclassified Minwuia TaxID=2618799 RepID=UPI00247A4FFD|nr:MULTISPECIES: hydantoinase B/oxoprolinase family protein [unclassified Minwuia]
MPDTALNTVSAVDQAIITQALIAAAHEMGVKLIRSAHSTIVREAEDCSSAILDARGNVVAQSELIPLQLGSIAHTFGPCAKITPPETLQEGDFYITNDPYNGGQHLPDVFLFSPIFVAGRLIGFSATVAHHIDLGGGAPGLNPDATDVHQEGIIFPPSRWNLDRDWRNDGALQRMVRANIRMPDHTIGDFEAQFAANQIGIERVRDLCARHGTDRVESAMTGMLDYAERRMRAALEAVPDGTYHGEDFLDDDGQGSGPLRIAATVTVKGSDIAVDFDGSSPQVKTNINSPFASTVGAALSVIKSALTSADLPFNSGCARAVTITAPHGSILNPIYPAPVRARLLPTYRVFNAVMKALAQAVPDRVIASGYDTTYACCLSHLGPKGYNIYLEIFGGGYGAGPANDGCNAVDSPLSNCGNIPIEAQDMAYPFFRVRDYSLVAGSGGAGRHRGGLGFQRIYEITADDVTFAAYGDRFDIAPEGLFGGGPGGKAEAWIERDGEKVELPSKTSMPLLRGDLLVVRTGGGAGYGPAEDRSARHIARDLTDGYIAE